MKGFVAVLAVALLVLLLGWLPESIVAQLVAIAKWVTCFIVILLFAISANVFARGARSFLRLAWKLACWAGKAAGENARAVLHLSREIQEAERQEAERQEALDHQRRRYNPRRRKLYRAGFDTPRGPLVKEGQRGEASIADFQPISIAGIRCPACGGWRSPVLVPQCTCIEIVEQEN